MTQTPPKPLKTQAPKAFTLGPPRPRFSNEGGQDLGEIFEGFAYENAMVQSWSRLSPKGGLIPGGRDYQLSGTEANEANSIWCARLSAWLVHVPGVLLVLF
jgi:hypothetical protein